MNKNNTWNIRCLVGESFVPAFQPTSKPANQHIIFKIVGFHLPDLAKSLVGNVWMDFEEHSPKMGQLKV